MRNLLSPTLAHNHLRRDPIHGLICGKSPLGQDRLSERDKGKALAAHSEVGLDMGKWNTEKQFSSFLILDGRRSQHEDGMASPIWG